MSNSLIDMIFSFLICSETRLLHELERTIDTTVHSPNEKNVNVLLNASKIGRYISGFMSILCKSGKGNDTYASTSLIVLRFRQRSDVHVGISRAGASFVGSLGGCI